MTKEITKAIILQEMQDKFKLRELEPEVFRFSEMVVPTYNIGPHLTAWGVKKKTLSITSGPTGYVFFTVPQNEQWTMRAYQVIFGATGAHKGTGMYVKNRPLLPADSIYIDMKKAQEVSYLINLNVPIVLQPNNQLGYYIDSYTSTQDLTIDIDVMVEEIR